MIMIMVTGTVVMSTIDANMEVYMETDTETDMGTVKIATITTITILCMPWDHGIEAATTGFWSMEANLDMGALTILWRRMTSTTSIMVAGTVTTTTISTRSRTAMLAMIPAMARAIGVTLATITITITEVGAAIGMGTAIGTGTRKRTCPGTKPGMERATGR